MKKLKLFTLIFAAMILCGGNIFAQTSVCRVSTFDIRTAGQAITTDWAALLTVEVLPNGHINLILSGSNNPTWRAEGIRADRTENILVGGAPNIGQSLLLRSNAGALPAGTTSVLTFIPQVPIADGTLIEFNNIYIEYTVNLPAGGTTGPWPGVTFSFVYDVAGANNCVFTPVATPVINSITPAGVINFTSASTVNYVYVFRADNTIVHRQAITDGGTINFTTLQPTEFTVRLRAIATDVMNDDSELSAGIQWTPPVDALPPSAFCGTPVVVTGGTGGGLIQFLHTIETVSGDIVVSIAGYAGDPGTYFRGTAGWIIPGLNLNVNGVPTAFTRTLGAPVATARFTYFRLTPDTPLTPGDIITFSGTVEYVTSTNTNGWGTINITYIFGTTCAGLPTLNSDNFLLSFNPTQGLQTFTLTGVDLTSDLVITAPHGLNVSPAVITPAADGSVNTVVTVTWAQGNTSGIPVVVSGGGLPNPLSIGVQTSGFNLWCNQVIGAGAGAGIGGAAYRTFVKITVSDCRTEVHFDKNPYRYYHNVRWAGGSIPLANVSVAGNTAIDRVVTDDRITITFDEPLADGDVVTFGAPIVWWIDLTGDGNWDNQNAFINPAQTFTVGDCCSLYAGIGTLHPEIPQSSVILYPNPVTDILHFSETVRAVNIFTVLGQRVLSEVNVNQVNVSHLPSGLYIVNAVDADGNQISAVIEVR